jgi:hypothetical protein
MQELKKIHGPELEDPRSVPFNVDGSVCFERRHPAWLTIVSS